MDADQIVNSYFSQKQSSQQQAQNPADVIVNSFLGKQNPNPHPLDDTYVQQAKNDQGDQSYNNYCETFAEQLAYGHTGLFSTAQDAWNNYAQEGKAIAGNVNKAPAGSMVYFQGDSSNSGEGHVALADGQGNLVGATSQGVRVIPIKQWIDTTHQKPLGYVIPNK